MLDQAIRDRSTLMAHGCTKPVYVNVSGELVGEEASAANLLRRLHGLSGGICIEITETAVVANPQRALQHLPGFAAAGIKIVIDDYAAGWSSLSYLKQLPATELKLDMMFITQLSTSHRDPMIVRSTIELANGLGLQVTAEGVEDDDAVALLRVMSCDNLQGYLIARPMPLGDLLDFLDRHSPAASKNSATSFPAIIKADLARAALLKPAEAVASMLYRLLLKTKTREGGC